MEYCYQCKKDTPRIRKLKGELCKECRVYFPHAVDPYPSIPLVIITED